MLLSAVMARSTGSHALDYSFVPGSAGQSKRTQVSKLTGLATLRRWILVEQSQLL